MAKTKVKLNQLVDWNAALWAGILSGLVSFLAGILISWIVLDIPWFFPRLVASLIMGDGVLPPPASFDLGIVFLALLIHLALSVAYVGIIAMLVHEYGIMISFIGGALFGLAIYLINFYTLSYFFPWFYQYRGWIFIIAHLVYGALAGSLYEMMEVEKYVPVKE
jgi:hypothetical protein